MSRLTDKMLATPHDFRFTPNRGTMIMCADGVERVQIEPVYHLHFTANQNYRILVNGKVHPLLCGLPTPEAAIEKLKAFDPKGTILNLQEFTDPK